MAPGSALGRVVVVAGDDERLVAVAAALVSAGALVAFVGTAQSAPTAHASFRAEPGDPQVWERVAPHVEQRLGPVDAVVTDAATHRVLEAVFAPDMKRRGHGGVLVLTPDVDAATVLSRLTDML